MTVIFASNFYEPRPVSEQAPVRVEIELFPEDVDRDGPIPKWPFTVKVTLSDFRGIARHSGGTIEALSEEQAKLRVYCEAIEVISELLAERVKRAEHAAKRP